MEKISCLFDDTYYCVDIYDDDFENILRLKQYEYSDFIGLLLTEKQYEKYIMNDTFREIKVSRKRLVNAFEWLNSDKNIWRK